MVARAGEGARSEKQKTRPPSRVCSAAFAGEVLVERFAGEEQLAASGHRLDPAPFHEGVDALDRGSQIGRGLGVGQIGTYAHRLLTVHDIPPNLCAGPLGPGQPTSRSRGAVDTLKRTPAARPTVQASRGEDSRADAPAAG